MPTQNNDQDDDPKTLRGKLENALQKLGERDRQLADMSGRLVFHEAGLSHLSNRRRNALLSDFEDPSKVTVEELQAAAKEEGWDTPPSTQQQQDGQQQGDNGNQQQSANNGQGTQVNGQQGIQNPPTGQPPVGDPSAPTPDMIAAAAAAGISAEELASVMAQRPTTYSGTYDDAMKNAKTQEEVMAAIQQAGPTVGVMLSTDVE